MSNLQLSHYHIMHNETLLSKIDSVEKLASSTKMGRLLRKPIKYIEAILFRELFYRMGHKAKQVKCKTFFDTPMDLLLPSGTDIFLTGGKTHNSEIRLARYIIRTLCQGDIFIDVGAHYGYFTLLASKIVGTEGQVHSFEAAPKTYKVLNQNCHKLNNIMTYNYAISDTVGHLNFFEFHNRYCEYNTIDSSQFENETWYKKSKPNKITIKSLVLDDILAKNKLKPKLIKIDVEGAEDKVIKGMKQHVKQNHPIIIMEYLSEARGNDIHQRAAQFLISVHYNAFIIDNTGRLINVKNVSEYLATSNIESDNIVFLRS